MEYTVSKVTPEEVAKVDDFIHEHFFSQMPLVMMFGLDENPPPRSPPRQPAAEDFTVQAVDTQGEMIGVAINRFHCAFSTDSDTPPDVKKMVEFLAFAEQEAELSNLPERTIELRVLSVRQDWRQRGVARRLAEESMRLARATGFTNMKVCCTSEFTAKLARSMGWREHYRLAYKDYPLLSGNQVYLKPIPPHDYFYYYITDL